VPRSLFVCCCSYRRSFDALRKEFAQDGSVQLQKFLSAERSERLSAAVAARDNADFSSNTWPSTRRKPEYTDGLCGHGCGSEGTATPNGGWSVVGPAHMQRYLRFDLSEEGHDVTPAASSSGTEQPKEVAAAPAPAAPAPAPPAPAPAPAPPAPAAQGHGSSLHNGPSAHGASKAGKGTCEAGKELASIRDGLFGSLSFARLMYAMTGLRPVGITAEARRFRPGLDYTVAHHGLLEKEARLDATLSFIGSSSGGGGGSSGSSSSSSTSGDVGGNEVSDLQRYRYRIPCSLEASYCNRCRPPSLMSTTNSRPSRPSRQAGRQSYR
jgi:hypothetical protein